MNEVKAILLCGSRFAMPAMQQLLFLNQLTVVAIPAHCKEMIGETQAVLKAVNIPIIILTKETFHEQLLIVIEKYKINTGLIMTFSYIISPDVYKLPAFGFYNFHPGSLPEYRGADPIFQQIRNKEKKAAVTVHKLAAEADMGDIVLKQEILLLPDDTHGLLNNKLAYVAANLAKTLLKLVGYGFAVPSKKQDELKANYFKRQMAKDISIDWQTMDAETIVALINACNPWNKGAVTTINGKIIRLVQAIKIEYNNPEKLIGGIVKSVDPGGITILTIDGHALKLEIIYTDEGFFKASRLKEFGLLPGSKFESIANQ